MLHGTSIINKSHDLIADYQINKLFIAEPDLVNIMIILLLFVLSVISVKRSSQHQILHFSQTQQLKGMAIFFIVLGHLWVHVAASSPYFVFSGDAVSLFLILSGFGLTRSIEKEKLTLKEFLAKRVKKVMVPYWIATIVILLFDSYFLNRHLSYEHLAMTFLGLNLYPETSHIDYVRWFVTFILIWYMTFFIVFKNFQDNKFLSLSLLFLYALVTLPVCYYFIDLGWYQFFSFPIGCALALYYENVISIYQRHKNMLLIASIGVFSYVLLIKFALWHSHINDYVFAAVPNILLKFYYEFNSIVVSIAVLLLFNRICHKGYYSRFLKFLGEYSYELFLLHGAFLIKYNPVIKGGDSLSIIVQFTLYILMIIGFSIILSKASNYFYAKKIS